MSFLTPEQRIKAVDRLRTAPDEVLLSALVELRKVEHFEEGMLRNLNTLLDERRTQDVPVPTDLRGTGIQVKEERANVSPGASSISKISTGVRALITAELMQQVQPEAKYREHLKLLWSRGEVKFDGQVFYL